MVVKPAVISNTLMPPPSNNFITPSSSRSRNNDICRSSDSRTKSTPTVHKDSHVIVSICEGRGKAQGLVGIAAIDIHRPVLILSEICDMHSYTATLTKLNIMRPYEVLVPATFIDNATPSRLVTVILNQFPNLSVNTVPRSEFNRSRGLQIIQTICAPSFSDVILQISDKFYALSASCALLRYIQQCRNVLYAQKTVKVEFHEPEDKTAIDIDTAGLLELIGTYTGKQKNSLFTILNYCSTVVGKKLLHTNILQPPRRKTLIETRLDCVQELIENPNLLTRFQECLRALSDIHASLTFATVVPATASSVSERQLNYTLQLKGLLIAIQPLANELKATKHPLYRDIYNRLEGLDTRKIILDKINKIINEDAHLAKGQAGELQRCFAIKSCINGFLDLSRRLYTEGVDSMRSYVDELTSQYNLPLRVQHTIKSGFHIILPLNKALRNLRKTDLPPIFINVEKFRSHFYLTTQEMVNFDRRLKNNSIEIQNISNVIIYELLVSIKPYIGDLYDLCDDVAQLDLLVSLARVSSQSNWVRPKLVDTHMNLEGARHPILESTGHREFVSHSIYAYPRNNIHIITGPNMSGKTIFLHTICLLQVLCQIGCYVPCTLATFRISQRISARVAEEDSTLTHSSFSLEMTKLSYLLNTLTDTSLIVLDELCKTTACDEGVSIAMAVTEKLAARGCFVFIASHFLSLTIMEDMYPNIKNWYLETLEENRANNTRISLKFTYKLLPGVTKIDAYGIKLSRIFNSSKSISDRAEALYNWLLPLRKSVASESRTKNPNYLKFKFQSELDLLKIKNQLTDEIQKDKIDEFKQKTGLNFEPSPISIERTNSNSFQNQTSTKTSSDSAKKVTDSTPSMPCLSSKSNSSNHEFSVPTSLKTDENLEKTKSDNHIFSLDGNCSETNFTFTDTSISGNMTNTEFVSNVNFDRKTFMFMPDNTKTIDSDLTNFEQYENWSSAENTIKNAHVPSINLIINSTKSNEKDFQNSYQENLENNLGVSKTSISNSLFELSSPILTKKSYQKPSEIKEKSPHVRLVSEMYDSEISDEEVMEENISVNEESFGKDLLKKGLTSTPKCSQNRNNETISDRNIDTTTYFSLPTQHSFSSLNSKLYESPIISKRKSVNKYVGINEKNQRLSSESSRSFASFKNSPEISKYSASVIIGQNEKKTPVNENVNINEKNQSLSSESRNTFATFKNSSGISNYSTSVIIGQNEKIPPFNKNVDINEKNQSLSRESRSSFASFKNSSGISNYSTPVIGQNKKKPPVNKNMDIKEKNQSISSESRNSFVSFASFKNSSEISRYSTSVINGQNETPAPNVDNNIFNNETVIRLNNSEYFSPASTNSTNK